LPVGGRPGSQLIRTALPLDHLTGYDDWLAAQDGEIPPAALAPVYDPVPRYVRNGRDLAEAVHWDWPGQAVHQACLLVFGLGASSLAGLVAGDAALPLNPTNPYAGSRTQAGFVTFGLPDITSLVGLAAGCALKAAWYQKWFVHRRLRPEEFGGRVHHATTGTAAYPVHADLLERSAVLAEVVQRFGTALLPQAYPEGLPDPSSLPLRDTPPGPAPASRCSRRSSTSPSSSRARWSPRTTGSRWSPIRGRTRASSRSAVS
jgi:hypothetical protein